MEIATAVAEWAWHVAVTIAVVGLLLDWWE